MKVALLAAAAVSLAAPAKMVVVTAQGVAITDYNSMERCLAARQALKAEWQAEMNEGVPSGYKIIVPAPFHVICIPG